MMIYVKNLVESTQDSKIIEFSKIYVDKMSMCKTIVILYMVNKYTDNALEKNPICNKFKINYQLFLNLKF